MEIVLGTNFDDRLVGEVDSLPVSTFFGGFPYSFTGGGRPPYILPSLEEDRFRRHVQRIHSAGRKFFATLNSNDLGLKEYRSEFLPRFRDEVDHLLDLGVDGFVVALPVLMEALHADHPEVPISVSTFARIRTVNQARYFRRLGADTVILEEANRDFALIRGLVREGLTVEVLTNQTCIRDCPYRAHHLNTSSLASQTGAEEVGLWFEYPLLECGTEVLRDPSRLISSIWVRPEDLAFYEEQGVHRFKISGRNRTTDWLVRAARAYSARKYEGNLLDILSYVQVKGPSHALGTLESRGASPETVEPLLAAFRDLSDVHIDNSAFPAGFLQRIARTDCEHTSCAACGYCAGVAEKVLRIGGRPPSAYRPPSDLPSGHPLLPHFGASG